MTTAIETIRIGEDEIQGVRDEHGTPWVVVRRACESLGLDESSQRKRLQDPERSPWAVTVTMTATGPDGKNYEVFCMHADTVPMWLATVDTSRCLPGPAEKVRRWQREAARILADWAYGRRSEPSAALDLRDPAALRGLLAQLAEVNLEQQAKIAELTPPATAWRDLAECHGNVNLQTAGKALGLPPNLWIADLRRQGILFYRGRNLVARQDMLDAGRFVQRVRVKDGEEFIQTLVTPRGLSYFGERRPGHLQVPRRLPAAHRPAQHALPGAQP